MSGFSAEWLALREPHDLRARNRIVLDAVGTAFNTLESIGIVDLACGAGSTVRALGPQLPATQHWNLVDNDPRLLEIASNSSASANVTLHAVELDLAQDIEAALDRATDLVTMSALLDLVASPWLHRFAGYSAARALPVYAALTYDGRVEIAPADSLDEAVMSALNAHQRTDKGFGPALGPTAASMAVQAFEALGYSVVQGTSDWTIGPGDRQMQVDLLNGWATAAHELGTIPHGDVDKWLARRNEAVRSGVSTLRVGHVDFFATPSVMR